MYIAHKTYCRPEELVVIGRASFPDVVEENRKLRQVNGVTDPRGHEESSPAEQPVQQACNLYISRW